MIAAKHTLASWTAMNITKPISHLVTLLTLGMLVPLDATAQAKKLKVFILAGQSNMEGHARIETFDYLGAPEMPFVIGVMGVDGINASDSMKAFREAMTAPALVPEFRGQAFAEALLSMMSP